MSVSSVEQPDSVTVRQRVSFLSSFCFWKNRKKADKVLRTVLSNASLSCNVQQCHPPHRDYRNNRIRTTKYTLLSFIPKNLFEQFHRFANLYFIFIVLLNWVPRINAFGKEIAIIPVVFVLGVTAIKDWFEDYRRYKSDKRVNNNTCRVYNSEAGRYVKTTWKSVKVGDFVHLSCNEVIPADLLLLRCSDEHGLCYIETANLDGESNLKQREVTRCFLNAERTFHPSSYHCRIECDPPNHRIYRFNGCVIFPSGERVPISKENLLLRDCVVKNADFVEGIVVYAGHETKAMLNNGGPRYKRSELEKLMNRDVVFCVFILLLLCFLGALGHGFWLSSFSDITSVPFLFYTGSDWYEVPLEAFYVFLTFIIVLQVMIPLSLYVTIEIIKLGQVYFIHEDMHLYDSSSRKRPECRALNITEELGQVEYIFSDKTGTLTENNMVFRRCTIGGVDYNHERTTPTISDGDDCSLYDKMRESNSSRHSTLIPNDCLQEELSKMEIQLRLDSSPTEIVHLCHENQRIQDFFLLLAVCNTVVVAKYPHKDQMNSSGLCLNVPTPTMFRHKSCGEGWESPTDKYAHLLSYTTTPNSSSASTPAKQPCSLAIPNLGFSGCSTPTSSPFELKPIYEAESPDEIALVNAAFAYNCRLLRRTPETVVLSLPGEGLIEFQVLHVLPFDATRKRMSIILEHPFTGQKILYCKGADSTVFTHLAPAKTKEMKKMILKTQQHLNSYSRKGLRILCMAKKVISPEEYEIWLQNHKEAEYCIEEKEKKLFYSACAIENNMELLGATGIEDRLQEGVPTTIHALRSAGISIWVLTGDKQETAVNIAYSCKLFSTDMEVITLNARSKEAAEETIKFYLDQINKDIMVEECPGISSASSTESGYFSNLLFFRNRESAVECSHHKKQRALVVDGHTLAFILDQDLDKLFLKLAQHCTSVLCCRATPLQKASVVKLIKDTLRVKTLAIGDGANDVSMIQIADVGVGISGCEGMQAVMASDFSLARFHYLERLLLVHGHWCYDRLARTVLYFFYKNASFIFVICWYQWFCGFSATVMIDDIYLMLFNVIFISLPPIVQGILDKDCPEDLLLRYPHLYSQGQKSEIHTKYSFWFSMLDAVYQSIITFFIPFIAYNDSTVDIWEFGTTICTACVLVQLVHLAIETRSWTYLNVLSIFISLDIYFGFAIMYNTWPAMSVGLLQNPYWVIIRAMCTPVFWFSILLVPVLSCLPRLTLRALQGTMFPNTVTAALSREKCCKTSSDRSTLSVSWSRESSGSSADFHASNRVGVDKSHSKIFFVNGSLSDSPTCSTTVT